jgi:hypothetical protein
LIVGEEYITVPKPPHDAQLLCIDIDRNDPRGDAAAMLLESAFHRDPAETHHRHLPCWRHLHRVQQRANRWSSPCR